MKPKIHAQSPIIAMLLEGIEKNPGIESHHLATLVGRSWPHVKKGLAFMNANKIAGYCELGKVRRGWFVWAEAEKRNAGFMSVKEKSRLRSLQRPPSARSKIEGMAADDEDGASLLKICERLEMSEKDAHRHCLSLVKRGRLFKATRSGCRARWFKTEAAALAWESLPAGDGSEFRPKPGRPARSDAEVAAAQEKARKAREQRAQQRLVAATERLRSKARQPSKAPPKLAGSDQGKYAVIKSKPGVAPTVTIAERKSSQEVDYSRAKITICPAPQFNYRHEYAPGSEAWTGFVREWQQLRGAA